MTYRLALFVLFVLVVLALMNPPTARQTESIKTDSQVVPAIDRNKPPQQEQFKGQEVLDELEWY